MYRFQGYGTVCLQGVSLLLPSAYGHKKHNEFLRPLADVVQVSLFFRSLADLMKCSTGVYIFSKLGQKYMSSLTKQTVAGGHWGPCSVLPLCLSDLPEQFCICPQSLIFSGLLMATSLVKDCFRALNGKASN